VRGGLTLASEGGMRTCLLLVLTLAAACATVPGKGASAPSVASSEDDSNKCSFDSDCFGGSCRFGECSPFPPDNPSCAFDSDCPGGSCRAGSCSPQQPDSSTSSGCTFDTDCSSGTCQAGVCTP
jgi:hypothetical protein